MLMLGVPTMSAAATFVYVSDAEDATIDAYVMDTKTGALTTAAADFCLRPPMAATRSP